MSDPITMQDVRLAVGEGPLTPADVLAGCNADLRRREMLAEPMADWKRAVEAQDQGAPAPEVLMPFAQEVHGPSYELGKRAAMEAAIDETCPICEGAMGEAKWGEFCIAGCRAGMVRSTSANVLRNVKPFLATAPARLVPVELVERLRGLMAEASQGQWQLQDGCSWRRIGTHFHDGNVLSPIVNHRDGHPDLTAGRGEDLYANLRLIVEAINAMPMLLDALSPPQHHDLTDEQWRTAVANAPKPGALHPASVLDMDAEQSAKWGRVE